MAAPFQEGTIIATLRTRERPDEGAPAEESLLAPVASVTASFLARHRTVTLREYGPIQ
jgi:hypothetical protein